MSSQHIIRDEEAQEDVSKSQQPAPEPGSGVPKQKVIINLRDDKFFPSFPLLPDENSISLEFYTTPDGFTYRPKRHWCLLAEVLSVEYFIRLRLIVHDKSGILMPIAFHTDQRGTEFRNKVLPGHTVAILYAIQHDFMDLSKGIRLEEGSTMKIFPISLADLFRLSDKVQDYSFYSTQDKKRKCHGCDEWKSNLQKCAKCSCFWYCNKACQSDGWIKKDHKQDCKVLRDMDLQAIFFSVEWDSFQGFVKFPLST